MPVKPVQKITAWSFSRWSTYELCPLKAKLAFIDKIKEPQNAAMARGTKIHELAEFYVNGNIKKLPVELTTFAEEFQELLELGAQPEQEWAFTRDWQPCDWFSPDAWVRIKVDANAVSPDGKQVVVIDYKTGRVNLFEHRKQLTLYAIAAFIMFPHIDEVICQLWYVDQGEMDDGDLTFKRSQLPELKKQWEKAVKPMLNDTTFAPRPNDKCKWCFFRKSNGGPCVY